jgi:hypothetical protein
MTVVACVTVCGGPAGTVVVSVTTWVDVIVLHGPAGEFGPQFTGTVLVTVLVVGGS